MFEHYNHHCSSQYRTEPYAQGDRIWSPILKALKDNPYLNSQAIVSSPAGTAGAALSQGFGQANAELLVVLQQCLIFLSVRGQARGKARQPPGALSAEACPGRREPSRWDLHLKYSVIANLWFGGRYNDFEQFQEATELFQDTARGKGREGRCTSGSAGAAFEVSQEGSCAC